MGGGGLGGGGLGGGGLGGGGLGGGGLGGGLGGGGLGGGGEGGGGLGGGGEGARLMVHMLVTCPNGWCWWRWRSKASSAMACLSTACISSLEAASCSLT